MALDAGSIATGVASGLVTQKTMEVVNKATQQGPSYQDEVLSLLRGILESVGPKEKENINRSVALQPYPYEYIVDEEWFNKSHLCIFFHDSTPIRFDVEGAGIYLKTVGPGWVQCDVRGHLSTTDSQNHNVIISYREDALGAAL